MNASEESLKQRIIELEREIESLERKYKSFFSESQYRSFVENSSDMIYFFTIENGYEYVSASSENITGYAPDEWYGDPKLLCRIVSPDLVGELREKWKELKNGITSPYYEYKIIKKTGEPCFIRQRNIIIKNTEGQIIGFEGDITDITEIKNSEENLKKLMARLSRSNEDLDEFATAVSHDLQEPLMIISNFTQILINDYINQLDNRGKDFLRYVSDASNHMKGLLDGLLAYSRITAGKHYRKTVTIKAVVSEALKNLKVLIKNSQSEIMLNLPDGVIICDPYQMARAIQNAVSNAIKFCDKEVPVVEISAALKDDVWTFAIKDNGIGIKKDNLDNIFKIFHREYNDGEFEGAGVGLAMFKKIIERHGGTISVSSVYGEGSTFSFTLPN